MKKIKNIVLFSSLILLIIVFVSENPITFGFCKQIASWSSGDKYCVDNNIFPETVRQIGGFVSIITLFFSLLTYRMKDEVFRAWWSFAWWWALVIIGTTLFLWSAGGRGGGWGIGSGVGNAIILWPLYFIFVSVSFARIFSAYVSEKSLEKGASSERLAKIKFRARMFVVLSIVLFFAWMFSPMYL